MASKPKGYTVRRCIGGVWYPVLVCPPKRAAGTKPPRGSNPFATYNVNGKPPGTLPGPSVNLDNPS